MDVSRGWLSDPAQRGKSQQSYGWIVGLLGYHISIQGLTEWQLCSMNVYNMKKKPAAWVKSLVPL